MTAYDEFLTGERPEDIALYLSESFVSDVGSLADHGEEVDDGVVLVVDGDRGRSVFQKMTGMQAMQFSQQAMQQDGDIGGDLASGECPDAADSQEHSPKFIFAFSEEQNEEVGGLYAEGDVIHAYAHCSCGESYSDRWVIDQ